MHALNRLQLGRSAPIARFAAAHPNKKGQERSSWPLTLLALSARSAFNRCNGADRTFWVTATRWESKRYLQMNGLAEVVAIA
jgi:hypothetical protein